MLIDQLATTTTTMRKTNRINANNTKTFEITGASTRVSAKGRQYEVLDGRLRWAQRVTIEALATNTDWREASPERGGWCLTDETRAEIGCSGEP